MSRPRILLVLTELAPRIGGMQTHASYLCRGLVERGYRIRVVTVQATNRTDDERAQAHDQAAAYPISRTLSRIGHHHNLEVLRREAGRCEPDLVYCSTVFYGHLADELGVPVIARSVGNDVLRPWIAYPYRPLSGVLSHPALEEPMVRVYRRLHHPERIEAAFRRQRRELMAASACKLTRILANSRYTGELLQQIGVQPRRIEVVTGGVDAARFATAAHGSGQLRRQLAIPAGRFVLLSACRMVRKKGVELLIDAMAELLTRMPDLHLLLVGGGRHYRRFRRRAARGAAAHRITFTGPVPHDGIGAYYGLADAFVLASRVLQDPVTGWGDAETMGRVLCEANAAGVPVVAARSGGIPSVVEHGHNGLLFTPDDAGDLAAQLAQLRASPSRTRLMVQAGRRLARERFDWSVIVDRHEACFARALGGAEPDRPSQHLSVVRRPVLSGAAGVG